MGPLASGYLHIFMDIIQKLGGQIPVWLDLFSDDYCSKNFPNQNIQAIQYLAFHCRPQSSGWT